MELPIPDDWDGESTCRYAVCWPDSVKWKAILYGLIESPMQGRIWDFSTGSFLTLREQFRPIFNYNFDIGECLMACNDTGLADAFNNIATAITKISVSITNNNGSSSVCCEQQIIDQNGGIAGSTTQPGTGDTIPIFGTEPPVGVPPGTYPDGYTSEEEYLLDKCQVSNLIVDGFIGSLRGLGALGVFNYIALAGLIVLAITGAIIFPPAFIPMAAAALGFLAAEVTVLTLVANEVEANREEWVCTLYNSESAEIAIQLVADLMDAIIASLSLTGGVGFYVKQIALLLLNANTLNQLMTKTAHLTYPDADCSMCPEGPGLMVIDGTGATLIEPNNEWVTITSANIGGSIWRVVLSDLVSEGGTGHNYIVEWRNYTSAVTLEMAMGILDADENSVWGAYPAYEADIEDPLKFNLRCGSKWNINSNFMSSGATQFTIEVRVTEGC